MLKLRKDQRNSPKEFTERKGRGAQASVWVPHPERKKDTSWMQVSLPKGACCRQEPRPAPLYHVTATAGFLSLLSTQPQSAQS